MKRTSYTIADGLLQGEDFEGARRYLKQRSASEKADYAFLRGWTELLWRESKIQELKVFVETIPEHSPELQALVTLSRIRMHISSAEFKRSLELAHAFFESAPVLLDPLLKPQIRFSMGKCWRNLRNTDRALIEYETALEEFEEAGDEVRKVDCLISVAQCRRTMRDWDGCIALYSQAILVLKSHGQALLSFSPMLNRGALHIFRGQFRAALDDVESSVQIARSYGRIPKLVTGLAARGLIEARSGSFDASATTLASALRIARSHNLIRHSCLLYEYIGELRFRQGNGRSARVWLNRAIALAQTRGLRDIEHESRCRLAEVELRDGNLDLAETHAREACENFESMNDQYEIAVCQRVIGQILWRRDRQDEANVFFDKANDFFSAVGELYESQKIARIRTGSSADIDQDLSSKVASVQTDEECNATDTVEDGQAKTKAKASSSRPGSSCHPDFPELLSESPRFIAALNRVAELARAKASLLILGESGKGKEAVVQGIHRLSPQRDGELVPFNCATSTPDMFDAEFYGHAKGSFTGAENKRLGLARTAEGGTLFLDEIGELGKDLQGRILRFLDSGEIRPVGSDRSLHVDVRIVAATHRQLDELEKAGRFRHDLRFRISELSVTLPPLRERPEDIPILVDHYLKQARERGIGKASNASQAVIDSMLLYSWPGNVRELRNEVFTIASFNPEDKTAAFWKRPFEDTGPALTTRDELIAALETARGNVARAGRLLGENRVNLYRLMRKFSVEPGHYRSN